MNIARWLDRAAVRWPDAPALHHGRECIANYASFQRRAAGFASWLSAGGAAPGDTVVLFMKNCPDYLIALNGVWMAGAVAVPVNAKLHAKEANWIIANAGARFAIVSPGLDQGLDAPAILDVSDTAFEAACVSPPRPTEDRGSDELAWLFYTSGTTGRPKGVMITHGMLVSMTLCYLSDVDEVRSSDAALYGAPMSHGAGLYSLVHTLKGAGHIFPLSGRYDPAEFLNLSKAHGSVSAFLAPTMIQRLTAEAKRAGRRGEGIRTIVYGGGPMYRTDIEAALDQFGSKFVQIYGQGECPMGITALSRADIADRDNANWTERIDSVGQAQTAVDVRILGPDGAVLPAEDVGEIAVRGSTVTPGYWKSLKATQETLKDGWLRTGDMGTISKEGYVTLRDRSKDLIISGGTNIYPREIEEVLLKHPSVEEVAVVGRASAEWGEEVVACIVLADGAECSESELDDFVLSEMARFKRPKVYLFFADLPTNAYGKVLKTELRALVSARQ